MFFKTCETDTVNMTVREIKTKEITENEKMHFRNTIAESNFLVVFLTLSFSLLSHNTFSMAETGNSPSETFERIEDF